ncbi:hypothetical protein LWE61_19990 [Sphingobium sufflavum]|uniref:hypothetical protein n=1 Tax=Sphingobium sufflavum TaxID=1129547 RepID=UPI001F1F0CFE|nr:hypothetical protein [Sphingobium sufflavum]MCE7798813.1 hypothetical protein [Sphingobium sufflavum]
MRKAGKLALMLLMLATGCSGPTRDQATLQAIHAEATALIGARPESPAALPRVRWPPTITSLEPETVTVSADGVDILMKPFFDGGSGYFIPVKARELPGPPGRYDHVGKGVYWYHPY